MPYDHKNTTPDGLSSYQMKLLLEEVNHLHCQKRCMIGSGGGSVGSVLSVLKTIVLCILKTIVFMKLLHSLGKY